MRENIQPIVKEKDRIIVVGGYVRRGINLSPFFSSDLIVIISNYVEWISQKIAIGFYHSLLLQSTGKVLSVGWNGEFQLCSFHAKQSTIYQQTLLRGTCIVDVAAGLRHSLFLRNDGRVFTSGHNSFGQMGSGKVEYATLLKPISYLPTNIIKVEAAGNSSLFVTANGFVWGAGCNFHGQLGLDKKYTFTPQPIHGLSEIIDVTLGGPVGYDSHDYYPFSFFLKSNGSVYNAGGNMGINYLKLPYSHHLRLILKDKKVTKIVSAVGICHVVFLLTGGIVWASGDNQNGQLGSDKSTRIPRRVLGVPPSTVDIATTIFYSLFLTQEGEVFCYQSPSSHYRLVNVNYSNAAVAQRVALSDKVVSIKSGVDCSFFTMRNGSIYACGRNDRGQLSLDYNKRFVYEPSPVSFSTIAYVPHYSTPPNQYYASHFSPQKDCHYPKHILNLKIVCENLLKLMRKQNQTWQNLVSIDYIVVRVIDEDCIEIKDYNKIAIILNFFTKQLGGEFGIPSLKFSSSDTLRVSLTSIDISILYDFLGRQLVEYMNKNKLVQTAFRISQQWGYSENNWHFGKEHLFLFVDNLNKARKLFKALKQGGVDVEMVTLSKGKRRCSSTGYLDQAASYLVTLSLPVAIDKLEAVFLQARREQRRLLVDGYLRQSIYGHRLLSASPDIAETVMYCRFS